jgi:3-hydroxyisobutyrate dehydrogenase-like beta-hydroxyacid dehydrogenase
MRRPLIAGSAATAKSAGIAMQLIDVALQLYTDAIERGHARHDMVSLLEMIAARTGAPS